MHILFLTDNFPPEGNAPASRTYEHAREWIKKGHKVTIITGAPNFPEGKVYKGYKNSWFTKEIMDGIQVWRVKTYITANEGFLRRILDFQSFMVSSFFAGLFVKRPDVIIGTSPQFFTVISAWALSAFKRKPFVFELRDIWPASITAVGAMKRSLVIRILEKVEMFLYRRADRIISVTQSFKNELSDRGVDASKIEVVLNGVDLTSYQPLEEKDSELLEKFNLREKFVVGYVGTHGMAHALEYLVEAAEHLRDNKDIVFMFAGGGAAKGMVEQLVLEKGLQNVCLIERQPKELMPKIWSLCDVSIVPLKNVELFKTVIPSKIFECMGMGIPIIMSVPEGEATQILSESGAGQVIPSEDVSSLVNTIEVMCSNESQWSRYRENGLKAAESYSRKMQASKMLDLLGDLVD